ncbi:hypothetical protein OG21DRAFT_1066966 [Imleria badia]|nr:hypothetical protein OG21DRAFT_1066966 [Imleria badia]
MRMMSSCFVVPSMEVLPVGSSLRGCRLPTKLPASLLVTPGSLCNGGPDLCGTACSSGRRAHWSTQRSDAGAFMLLFVVGGGEPNKAEVAVHPYRRLSMPSYRHIPQAANNVNEYVLTTQCSSLSGVTVVLGYQSAHHIAS